MRLANLIYWKKNRLELKGWFSVEQGECKYSWRHKGHSKNNETNVLQNGPKIIYLWYISTSFFLTQVKWLLTWVSHRSRINSLHAIFLSCLIIFGTTHKIFAGPLQTVNTSEMFIHHARLLRTFQLQICRYSNSFRKPSRQKLKARRAMPGESQNETSMRMCYHSSTCRFTPG